MNQFFINFVLNFITISREAASRKKRRLAEASLRMHCCKTIGFYLSLKLIGTVYETLTACPLCLPGFHCGIDFTTRKASLSILS